MPELTAIQTAGLLAAIGVVALGPVLRGELGGGTRGSRWASTPPQPVFRGAVALGTIGALLGTHPGVPHWRTAGFRRALAALAAVL